MQMTQTEQWYWCLKHERAEPESERCRAVDRMGPYATRDEAEHWREKVEERNREWRADDEEVDDD